MYLSQSTLLQVLQSNVVELQFKRRHEKPGWSNYRRMLCTNDYKLLNSVPGRLALHFKPPSHPPPYPWRGKNLACCWDLLWQQYRMVSCESVNIITAIPSQPPEQFWNYFNAYLQAMSPSDKVGFMNK